MTYSGPRLSELWNTSGAHSSGFVSSTQAGILAIDRWIADHPPLAVQRAPYPVPVRNR